MTRHATEQERTLDLDFAPLVLEDETVRLALLPDVGAKIISIRDTRSGREWVWRNPARSLRSPTYDSAFEDWDISGFDECLPGIAPEPYPLGPWRGHDIPDHGELWTLHWQHERQGNAAVRLRTHGVRFPYELEKEIRLIGDGRVTFTYTLRNHCEHPFPYIWCAHPLFQVTQSTRVLLPANSVIVDFSRNGVLGSFLDRHPWPITVLKDGARRDLSQLNPTAGDAYKLFAPQLSAGWAALHDAATGDFVGFSFSLDALPHCGVWINQRGWPFTGDGCFNAALEPCNGYPDSLAVAVRRGTYGIAPALGEVGWQLTLVVGRMDQFASIDPKGNPVPQA